MSETTNILKIIIPLLGAFVIGIGMTPLLTYYLYEWKLWKKKARTEGLGGGGTPLFNKLHKDKEINTPRMGGIIIWATTFITTFLFWLLSIIAPTTTTLKMNFLSQNQTWLPLATLVLGSFVGLIDDILVVRDKGGYIAGGIALSKRFLAVAAIGAVGAWWFYVKLETTSIFIPFFGMLDLGLLFIPFFIFVTIALFSSGVIDGIDGLSGGVMASIFTAYTTIAFFNNQIDLAALSSVITGSILVFLWFNIPPARFYMGETGILGLTVVLSTIAFLTDAVAVLPVIALPLVATSISNIIQFTSKKLRNGKKVFLIAPLHHHFEAMGWPAYKVTMRYWIISIISAITGIIIHFAGKVS